MHFHFRIKTISLLWSYAVNQIKFVVNVKKYLSIVNVFFSKTNYEN
jgi:hypothetical protein